MLVQEPVQAAIWHCLNHYAFNDAIFLAERLHAEVNSEDSIFLLATCYYRANQRSQCYSILKNRGTVQALNSRCRFLLSKCCIDMQKFEEAEEVLLPGSEEKRGKSPLSLDALSSFGDSTPFASKLLGTICQQTDRVEMAGEAFAHSLKLNPFLWDSYANICTMGENVDPNVMFQVQHLENFAMSHGTQTVVSVVGTHNQEPSAVMGLCNLNTTDSAPRYISSNTPLYKAVHHVKPIPMAEDWNVLNPSNKNRPAPKARNNLFTSTPMANNISTFGFLPLEMSGESLAGYSSSSGPGNSPFLHLNPFASPPPPSDPSEPRAKKPQQQSAGAILTSTANSPATPATPQQPLIPQTANVRRSSRLFSTNNISVKGVGYEQENSKTPSRNRLTDSKSPIRKSKNRAGRTSTVTSNNSTFLENHRNTQLNESNDEEMKFITPTGGDKVGTPLPNGLTSGTNTTPLSQTHLAQQVIQVQKQSAEGLMSLLRDLGKGFKHLCRFENNEAIEAFTSISSIHQDTGWVLGQIAKAHFELSNYEEAIKVFTAMRSKEPHRVEGVEWLSTALWHLQKEVELSALAYDLMMSDRKDTATWIAAGNCFSLHKEHETAIKYFKRAIQMDPSFAYGYTLMGHEYVATEELEKAMRCFRNAARREPRHYNAWYGIGMIYYKQERFKESEIYYQKAIEIHPNNSVLLCHLGVVQHAVGRTEAALATFSKALRENPSDPLCKFHRASVYFAINRLDDALTELEELKQIVPKESLVYFLIAKVYSKKGDTHKALLHFSWATDLDPRGANNQIKESIEPVLSRSITSLVAGQGDTTPVLPEEPIDSRELEGMELSAVSPVGSMSDRTF